MFAGRCVRFCLIANAHLSSMIDIYMMHTITVFTWINLSLSFLQHISYGILGCGLWWASQLIQLYNAFNSTGRRGSSIAVHSRRDIHLLILTFILMSFGLFNLGFPDFAFKTFVSWSTWLYTTSELQSFKRLSGLWLPILPSIFFFKIHYLVKLF